MEQERSVELISSFMAGNHLHLPIFSDNEIITQTLINTINNIQSNAVIHQHLQNLNDLIDGLTIAISAFGYIMRINQINRSELNNYIYYCRITPDGQLLRSNYHPIHLMTFMQGNEVPESFQKLFSDQNYLPNIINVWDRGHPESLLLISFQRINFVARDQQ